jgi:hypothetical protein
MPREIRKKPNAKPKPVDCIILIIIGSGKVKEFSHVMFDPNR